MKKIGPKWALTFERMRGDWPPAGSVSRRQMTEQLRAEGVVMPWSQFRAAFQAAGLAAPAKKYGWHAYTAAHVEAARKWFLEVYMATSEEVTE